MSFAAIALAVWPALAGVFALAPDDALAAFNARAQPIRVVRADVSLTLSDGRRRYETTGTAKYAAPGSFRLLVYRRVAKRQLAFDLGVEGDRAWCRDHLRGRMDERPAEEPAAWLWALSLRPAPAGTTATADGRHVSAVADMAGGLTAVARLDGDTGVLAALAVYRGREMLGWLRVDAWTRDGLPKRGEARAGDATITWTLEHVEVARDGPANFPDSR